MSKHTIILPLAEGLARFLEDAADRHGLPVAAFIQVILLNYWERHTPDAVPRPRLAAGEAP